MRCVLLSTPVACALMLGATTPLAAQQGTPPETIDILVDTTPKVPDGAQEDCTEEQEAASISGEIIVCGRAVDNAKHRLTGREDAEDRYARETMYAGDPPPPDVFGIPNHGTVVLRGCFIPPCPPPPAYYIDFTSLPPAPPGSDADRISRGLPPIGNDEGTEPVATPKSLSPSESASPAATPSG